MILLVAKPDGGGGYNLVNMTKEEFFALTGQSLDFTVSTGTSNIMTVNGTEAQLAYLAPAGVFLLTAATFGLSTTGTWNSVQLNDDGSITLGNAGEAVDGTLRMANAGFTLNATRTLTATIDDELALLGDQVLSQKVPLNAGSTNALNKYNTTQVLDASGGSIASHTVNFPSTPINNQVLKLTIYGVITSLTLSYAGTIIQPLTTTSGTITAAEWQYLTGTDTWYRIN